jgi:hypothetical protein
MRVKSMCVENSMKLKILPLLLALSVILVAACARTTPVPPPPTPELPQPTPLAIAQPVTGEAVLNGSYSVRDGQQTVQLTDGRYEAGQGADFLQVSVVPPVALGDLNGDGVTDAAVVLAENYGGSGTFLTLVPVLATPEGSKPEKGVSLGDRVQIQSVAYSEGRVTILMMAHNPYDSQCCPSQPQTRVYQYLPCSGLVLMSVSSQTANGLTRTITIDAPPAGSEVASPMPLQGSVTVAPFENNLVVNLYDASGVQVSAGPLTVTSEEMGGPGTFSASVDLAAASLPAGLARVEVVDTSPADGSILALAAVYVIYK